MSDIRLKSTAELDRLLSDCTSASEVAQATKRYFAERGIATRDDFGFSVLNGGHSAAPAHVVPVPATPEPDRCVRVICPKGNNRFEIYGPSEEALDQKEAQIRALFA